ncbi:zinc-binding dehydrogenase [Blastococcus sp. BMG 814]|uniref:Zinc-binding dehydrogenase n=1 Tax=Blastococcus carthaginiensis TaxID=3050034 RepID=A0ABT9I7Q4_9ACTN|nr:zinc-binding dehydrogenase [Blastococcus carthaginiensis]MDP5181601.1 zinc-binding dehydrogenase [Blastococcus carthaginiensis]
MGTGWFAAVAAGVRPGMTVAVVGDGAVGLLGVLSARQLGAERIIAMSRHRPRQELAREFGATDVVPERGDEAVERVRDLTEGVGADAVLECVGTDEAMGQAVRSTRAGGGVGFVGVPHGVSLTGRQLFSTVVRLHGGPAPVRRFLPDLIERTFRGDIDPGRVFDLDLPWTGWPTATAPWTSGGRSRRSCVRSPPAAARAAVPDLVQPGGAVVRSLAGWAAWPPPLPSSW